MEASEKTARLSVLVNLVLVGIKTAVSLLSGSLAVKADALHSLTDVVASAVTLIGIKISKRNSRAFPYGLYKVENLVALGTSVLIVFAGYEILQEVMTAANRPLPTRIPLAIAGIVATMIVAGLFSRYEMRVGHRTGSPSLVADARHIWTDVLSSLVILAALAGSAIGLALDRYAAVIVVFFIGRAALAIFMGAVRVLLDASLDFASLDRVRQLVTADSRVLAINELLGRNAGRYKFVELDITLRVKELAKGHRVAEELTRRIKEEIAQVDRVLIHCQPSRKEKLTYALPLAPDRSTISEHFGEAAWFRFLTLCTEDGRCLADQLLPNPFSGEEKGKGITVANWLLEKGLDVLLARTDQAGKGPQYVLENSGVEIRLVNEFEADRVVAGLGKETAKEPSPVKIPEEEAKACRLPTVAKEE